MEDFKTLDGIQDAITKLRHPMFKVKTISEFKALFFDPEKLDDELSPKINCSHPMILLCENSDFNETYLIDRLYDYLKRDAEGKNKFAHIWIGYVNDLVIRNYIRNPKETKFECDNLEKRKAFEHELPTMCFIVLPEKNDIFVLQDTPITTINQKHFDAFMDSIKF